MGLSVNGVLTRSVADTALFHDVASGAIASDVDSAPAPAVPFGESAAKTPGRLRIAFSRSVPVGVLSKLDANAERAFKETDRAAALTWPRAHRARPRLWPGHDPGALGALHAGRP